MFSKMKRYIHSICIIIFLVYQTILCICMYPFFPLTRVCVLVPVCECMGGLCVCVCLCLCVCVRFCVICIIVSMSL